jgi:hypothetical protein
MASARPLRDVFADLTGAPSAADDPAALLRDHGHPGLPDDLIAEAVVSYADTAPVEVAEHLAPYVTAHSTVGAEPVPGDEPAARWLDLLGTAPLISGDEPADLDGLTPPPGGFGEAAGLDPDPGLNFGTGAGPDSTIEPDDGAGDPAELDATELPGVELDEAELDDAGLDDAGLDDAAGWMPMAQETDLTAEEPDGDEGEPLG